MEYNDITETGTDNCMTVWYSFGIDNPEFAIIRVEEKWIKIDGSSIDTFFPDPSDGCIQTGITLTLVKTDKTDCDDARINKPTKIDEYNAKIDEYIAKIEKGINSRKDRKIDTYFSVDDELIEDVLDELKKKYINTKIKVRKYGPCGRIQAWWFGAPRMSPDEFMIDKYLR